MLDYSDFRQTSAYANFMSSLGWDVLRLDDLFQKITQQYGYLWKIPLIDGYYLSLHRINSDINLVKLLDFCSDRKVVLLRMDINSNRNNGRLFSTLTTHGFQKHYWCNSPTKTRIINLAWSMKKIMAGMKPKTRYNIRMASKKGVSVQNVNSHNFDHLTIDVFCRLLKDNHKEKGLAYLSPTQIHNLLKCFGETAFLSVAYYNNKMVAGALFLIGDSNTISYTQNCSNKVGKKLFAPTLLVSKAIEEGKRLKLKYFDFDGIYDHENIALTSSWRGFSRFKEGFGGHAYSFILPFQKSELPRLGVLANVKVKFVEYYFKHVNIPSIYPSTLHHLVDYDND